MTDFFKKHARELAFSFAIIICIYFFVHVLTLSTDYSAGVIGQAGKIAEFYTREQAVYVSSECESIKKDAEFFAVKITECQSEEDFNGTFYTYASNLIGDESYLDVLYLKDDEFYKITGKTESYSQILALKNYEKPVLSKVFPYADGDMAIAAYAKTDGTFCDGVAVVRSVYSISLEKSASGSDENVPDCVSKSEFSLLCKQDGMVCDRVFNTSEFKLESGSVFNVLFKKLFVSNDTYDKVSDGFYNKNVSSFVFSHNAEEYVLTTISLGEENGNLAIVCVYKISNVYGDGYKVNQNIWASLLGLGFIMIIMIVIIVATHIIARRKIYKLQMVDSSLNCPTPKKFEKNAEDILKNHQSSKFALVSLTINNFGYISSRFGEGTALKFAKHATEIIRGRLRVEETFGYAGEGEFLILTSYTDKQSFSERLNGLYLKIAAFRDFGDNDYRISVSYAIYEIKNDENLTVKDMFDRLELVKEDATVQDGSLSINYYEDTLGQNYIKKAEIEGRMEIALKNNEFHLFYQPKYNLRNKTMDGSEILIRWYDNKIEQYRVPGEFLPVFEENGFIVKIDHFVFYKACENIAERVLKRQICYPVSVNVSRVTATQPDFVDYYVRIKNKFGIKDNFITIEFTESFAYENYTFLAQIVKKMHENGFLCSIDDFGTGYSSYNILKTISMDEIKLDKFFLSKGISPERDQTLLKSVIEMVKQLGMKVTQEGVETDEDLYRLQQLGCDVIQGYKFAKPMKYIDYCEFIDKNFK